MSSTTLGCPLGLTELLRRFLAEEATSTLRHDIRNRLTALRNGAFYVHRRLEKETKLTARDPRLLKFLTQIDDDAGAIAELLDSRLPPVAEIAPAECSTDEVTAMLTQTALPSLRVKGNPAELQVALFCLLENAVGAVRVSAREGGWVALEVDVGLAADAELGIGLKVSRRVAERWGGALERSRSEGGSTVVLKLRAT